MCALPELAECVLGDAAFTGAGCGLDEFALLDRGVVLTINGASYRMRRRQERLDALRAGLQAAPAGR